MRRYVGLMCAVSLLCLASLPAMANEIILTFSDVSNYSGGMADEPSTYAKSGFTFTVPDGNHLDPFTATDCDILEVLCWHDGESNTIVDNILTLSFGGDPFDLLELDFGNNRGTTNLIVTSSTGDTMTINVGMAIAFNWTDITFVTFDIPDDTGTSATIPFLDNVVVRTVGEPPPTLAERVEMLEGIVINLQQQIDNLQANVNGHTHIYLTGNGGGHNVVEAVTGSVIFP